MILTAFFYPISWYHWFLLWYLPGFPSWKLSACVQLQRKGIVQNDFREDWADRLSGRTGILLNLICYYHLIFKNIKNCYPVTLNLLSFRFCCCDIFVNPFLVLTHLIGACKLHMLKNVCSNSHMLTETLFSKMLLYGEPNFS